MTARDRARGSGRIRRGLLVALVLGLALAAAAALPWAWRAHRLRARRARYRAMIEREAYQQCVDPMLVLAVVHRESRFDTDARGADGEIGLMQITPGVVADWERITGGRLQHDEQLFIPRINLHIGIWYLARALRHFRNHAHGEVLALSQYNAGPSRARAWAETYPENPVESIPIPSTRRYIERVTALHRSYQAPR